MSKFKPQYVRTKGGKTYHLFNNREVIKYLLFVAPKLAAAGDELAEGYTTPTVQHTEEADALLKIACKIRKNKGAKKKMSPFPDFDDDIPF